MARLAAQHLTDKLGQTFIVENRPSAGGAIATAQFAAAPDATPYCLRHPRCCCSPRSCKASFDPATAGPGDERGNGRPGDCDQTRVARAYAPRILAYARAVRHAEARRGRNAEYQSPAPVLCLRARASTGAVPAKGERKPLPTYLGAGGLVFRHASQLLPHAGSDRIRLLTVGTAQDRRRSGSADRRGDISRACLSS
jgi:hypothetical protein